MNIEVPKKSKDITQVIREVYGKIRLFFNQNKKNMVTFSQLVPSDSKDDKIYTFIPLLHLTTQRKIDLSQEQQFGEINIHLASKKEVEKELGAEV